MAETVYILSGSNIGNREKALEIALDKLENVPGLEVIVTSGIYLSDAQDMVGENPSFMNQVIMCEYMYLPHELLDALEKIEKDMGRTDKGKRKPREIDLDILLFGNEIINTDRLTIPHKELHKRPFAMIPLLQVNPDIVHPIKKKPVAEFIKKKDYSKVVLFKDHVGRNI